MSRLAGTVQSYDREGLTNKKDVDHRALIWVQLRWLSLNGPFSATKTYRRQPRLKALTHKELNVNPKSIFLKPFVLSICLAAASVASGQLNQGNPTLIASDNSHQMSAAVGNNLYCAGFIQTAAISTGNTIIGARNEADQFTFAASDHVFINMGRDKGVNLGDIYSVVRPRGTVKSKWSSKGNLGFYVEELGAVEVIAVKPNHSVAKIVRSCDVFLLGDVVQLTDRRVSPLLESRPMLDIYADPTGKPMGRIVMARNGAEMIARDQIAFVDLGAAENVRIGDRLTIFRLLEKGNITSLPDRESVSARDYGFESDTYKGGKFSNQAKRKSGDRADGKEVTTRGVRNERPAGLRKVVGEAVVLNVREKTATIVITRTGQEIHTGDWVEIQ
jgi:hypothetical protein